MIDTVSDILSRFSAVHYLIIAVNLILMLLAKSIIQKLGGKLSKRQSDFRVSMLHALNLGILATVCYNAIYASGVPGQSVAIKLISILVVLYLAYLAANIANYAMQRRYGKVKTTSDGVQISDTYHSRMLTLILSSFIAIVALITVIRIAGFNSLLEAGGVIGFVGVFLALTQQAWAPDIISGLVPCPSLHLLKA